MEKGRMMTGYLLAMAGATLFSTKAIFIKLAYAEKADPLLMLLWRMIFSLPFFAIIGAWMLFAMKRDGKDWPRAGLVVRALMVGLVGYYLSMILDFEALLHITAQLERLALFTYPMFLLFLGAIFFGAKLTLSQVMAAMVSYLGLALVFLADFTEGGSNVPLGTALVLGCAISFAVYQLLATDLIKELGSVLFTSLALSAAALMSFIHFAIARGGLDLGVSPYYLSLAAGTGVIATVIPSFFVNAGMERIGPQSTAMISTLSPLVTIYLAVLVLGESFQLIGGLGTALVVGGVGYHSWRDIRK